MDSGTYSSAASGVVYLQKMELNSNNIANVNTPGFKRKYMVTEQQDFAKTLAGELESQDTFAKGDHARLSGAITSKEVTDFSMGGINHTANPLDLALKNPNDFFVVNTPEGLRYTRAGNFTLGEGGNLVTMDGNEVQGDGGPITIADGAAQITPDGTVRSGINLVGRLQVVRFTDPSVLQNDEGTRFSLPQGSPPPQPVEPEIVPQSLEMSNVSMVSAMVDMISTARGFEAYTRMSQTIDQLNQQSITQIGRSR